MAERILIDRCCESLILRLRLPERPGMRTRLIIEEISYIFDNLSNVRGVLLLDHASDPLKPEQELSQLDEGYRDYADYGSMQCLEKLLVLMSELSVPIVSGVRGRVAGIKCCIALSADFCVASKEAYFHQAFNNIGLPTNADGLDLFAKLVGKDRAVGIMSRGERVAAPAAVDEGMIHTVVDEPELESKAIELVTRLARGPTLAYAAIRRQLRASFDGNLASSLTLGAENQRVLMQTADAREVERALREKRQPIFRGK